jgi:antitoxin VapB
MKTTKLFTRGKYQFVCLPEEFHFTGNIVYVKQIGAAVTLFPSQNAWDIMLDSLSMFSEDFMEDRKQPNIQNTKYKPHLQRDF